MGTWGVDLWDQKDILEKHTHNGIEFFEKCANFVKERTRIEQEYAQKLRKLVKQFQFKKKEEEDLPYTYQQAFRSFLKENDDYAGQREVISEEMQNNIFKEMHKLSSDAKTERKKTFKKMSEHESALDQHHNALLAAKRKYNSTSEDAANALKIYEQAAQRLDLTKAQILKYQKTSQDKGSIAEKTREEYKAALENFNSKQTLHYEGEMPNIINCELQKPEENLIQKLSTFLGEYSKIQQRVNPIISKCLELMIEAAGICCPNKDSLTFIEHTQTGELHPCDVEFEEFGKPSGNTMALYKAKTPKPTTKNKKKDVNDSVANDYADLPPAQRRIKFNKTITSLQDQLSQLEKQKTGMMKIMETSEKFGGDLDSIKAQIEATENEIKRIKPLLQQYESYLSAALESEAARRNSSRPPSVISTVTDPPAQTTCENRNDYKEVPPPPPPPPPPSEQGADEFDNDTRCRVLYDFSGSNENEMAVCAGEELILVEDDGSGWSRVERDSYQGYIPTSYFEYILNI